MPGMRDIAIHWYRKEFGAPRGSDIREEGLNTVLDGNSAVALSEAAIASHAVLGGSPPIADADSVWLTELERGGTNLFGEALASQTTEGPRGIVAAATGLALAGRRTTAFVSGTDIAAAQDLLISAAGKHAPLVLHLGTRAVPAHGASLGSGHESVHLSADSGFFMLFAANVQEAVDLTYRPHWQRRMSVCCHRHRSTVSSALLARKSLHQRPRNNSCSERLEAAFPHGMTLTSPY